MPENASTINVHHYFETSAHIYFIIIACCIALMAIVVLILLIIISIALYEFIRFRRDFHKRLQSRRESLKTQEERLSHSVAGVSSSHAISNPASMEREFGSECNSNVQSIPLSTFKDLEDRFGNSSGSSAGLYDVLFPTQHEGEIIYEPPTKLVDFPGQVFASTRKNSKADLNLGPSVSGLNADTVSRSLEWDYFQTKSCSESTPSEMESETRREQIVDVCWV